MCWLRDGCQQKQPPHPGWLSPAARQNSQRILLALVLLTSIPDPVTEAVESGAVLG